MIKCNSCNLFFPEPELHIGEHSTECVKCAEPWLNHENAFPGIVSPPAWLDLLDKATFRHTKTEIWLPMPGKPESSYKEAIVYEDESRYWRIEGRSVKFKNQEEAVGEVIQMAEIKRTKMLNDEFEREFGGNK